MVQKNTVSQSRSTRCPVLCLCTVTSECTWAIWSAHFQTQKLNQSHPSATSKFFRLQRIATTAPPLPGLKWSKQDVALAPIVVFRTQVPPRLGELRVSKPENCVKDASGVPENNAFAWSHRLKFKLVYILFSERFCP